MATDEPHEVAEIHNRLDEIARQIANIQRATEAGRVPPQDDAAVEAGPAPVERKAEPEPASLSLEAAIAQIAVRQQQLDRTAPGRAADLPQRRREPDFSSLHQQLIYITSQIESLRPPQGVEEAIAQFRTELADIREALTQAQPVVAIQSLESEIRALAQRIDHSRENGGDAATLGGIEQTLVDIREALRGLTPAEQLAGFDEAIRSLGSRIDSIVRTSDDPAAVHQLEEAISALRSVVSNIASTEALQRLSADVQTLSGRIDELSQSAGHGAAFAALEQRIVGIASALESRPQAEAGFNVEGGLRALSDRIDSLQSGRDDSDTFSRFERRIETLLERLEATNNRSADFARVETGLSEVLAHLTAQRASIEALQQSSARQGLAGDAASSDPVAMEAIKRELSDIRFVQSESDRLTQDSLEVVHTTLGHVVDRLAMIEEDLRSAKSDNRSAGPAVRSPDLSDERSPELPPRPFLPNPVTSVAPETSHPPPDGPRQDNARAELDEIKVKPDVENPPADPTGAKERGERAMQTSLPSRTAIDPGLPPDHPLEPGTGLPSQASAAERIAASEAAVSEIATPPAPQTTSSFIAAARRAARAASAMPDHSRRVSMMPEAPRQVISAAADHSSTITSRIRSLLVGTGVIVLALGGFKIATLTMDQGGEAELTAPIAMEDLENAPEPPTASISTPQLPRAVPPSVTSPVPFDQQGLSAPASIPATTGAAVPAPAETESAAIPHAAPPAAKDASRVTVAIPASERLPDGIGGPGLRAAALRGDPAAAYQVAVHYAEGKGVAASYDEAFKWYQRAADGNLAPALFRVGSFYEKGLGVKKNLETARSYYRRAADRGNAKAMHNLAVLDADGGGNGADYRSAAQWFRMAARFGIADSQYNLAILYARGIGVEQNLAESYKWFSLAAAQGDVDAGNKRDEIAKRLDAQSLAAAKLAVQTFTLERQPDEAVNVPVPPGGWDAVGETRRKAKTVAMHRAAR